MKRSHINPDETKAWGKLEKHFEEIKDVNINQWFENHPDRVKNLQIKWDSFLVDFSKNRINEKTVELLIELAHEMGLKEGIEAYFKGEKINETEDRAVLHTALRGEEKPEEVQETLDRMKVFSQSIIDGKWLGFSGKRITDIVNIGIGGSDLGPRMAVEALSYYRNHLNIHFISNIDGDQSAEVLKRINPETTLFIIVSKSFTTLETLHNAKICRRWFLQTFPKKAMPQHFIGVSSNIEEANKFGIGKKNIFPMWDWVGGRFSVWSAVGLSLCCAIGFENFNQFLKGAQKMDTHFRKTDFSKNIPVIKALISIWYNNFYEVETQAIIPYSSYLERLVPYLQQAFMESNGKNISRNRKKVSWQTGNIIWGATGSNAQHAFFQLLHQGTKLIPCDFIGFKKPLHADQKTHDLLISNFFAQTEALLRGKQQTSEDNSSHPASAFKVFEGNKPSTTLLINQLSPETLGSLLVLYEQEIFVQGFIWNIFSYDQWGVELGKELASSLCDILQNKTSHRNLDNSTQALVDSYVDD